MSEEPSKKTIGVDLAAYMQHFEIVVHNDASDLYPYRLRVTDERGHAKYYLNDKQLESIELVIQQAKVFRADLK